MYRYRYMYFKDKKKYKETKNLEIWNLKENQFIKLSH